MESKRRSWTPAEDEYLISHTMWVTAEKMGEHLGRSATSVGARLTVLRKSGMDVPYNTQKGRQTGKTWKPLPKQWSYDDIPDHIRIT